MEPMKQLRAVVRQYWGFDELRPLQAEAMQLALTRRDSLVVLPTGGGKSLCFQAPALCMPGLAVVVSPLISLMKDQVDALVDRGVAAAAVNSTSSPAERRRVADEIRAERLKLLYLSPERLTSEQMLTFLTGVKLSFFAIDEAHCISQWGHDFRPEYRELKLLKETFPDTPVHAYTATATATVREEIARELRLERPETLVGAFDRPNLVYRVLRRGDKMKQITEVIERHADESGVIYCLRRADVDELCEQLQAAGYTAAPYHAGMDERARHDSQEAFANDRVKIIVATVAFGMGIDKSDVRFVLHAAAPKSLESYQQESGRAGRDGLEAECCLFFSGADFMAWRRMQSELPPPALEAAMALLDGIEKFCLTVNCRHQAIVNYFGQTLPNENCGACDVCLGDVEYQADALVIAQKILSCVVRLQSGFGAAYVTNVLVGSREQRILEREHDQLSTHGILQEFDSKHIRGWVEQLVEQGFLAKSGEYNVLQITASGRELLRGNATPRLLKPSTKPRRESRAAKESWEGVDRELFESLRSLRRRKADERGLPPFVVFSDVTLRDMARRRPMTPEQMLAVHGVGQQKCAQYGAEFIAAIRSYCELHGVGDGRTIESFDDEPTVAPKRSSKGAKAAAFELFAQRRSIEDVCQKLSRAPSTVQSYLLEFMTEREIDDPTPWLDAGLFEQIRQAACQVETGQLTPLFEALRGAATYDQIRVALAALKNFSEK
ncbi:MAG: DNA helicase RecQ [Planctomycetes bacterium]|nr:DNA helicase RecQ [Planctomycetota bacterium]